MGGLMGKNGQPDPKKLQAATRGGRGGMPNMNALSSMLPPGMVQQMGGNNKKMIYQSIFSTLYSKI